MLLASINRNIFGVLIDCINFSDFLISLLKPSITVFTSSITVSCILNSPKKSHTPTQASVIVVEGKVSSIQLW